MAPPLTLEMCDQFTREAVDRRASEPDFDSWKYLMGLQKTYSTPADLLVWDLHSDQQMQARKRAKKNPLRMRELFDRLCRVNYTYSIAVAELNDIFTNPDQQYFLPLGVANNTGFSLVLDHMALEAHKRLPAATGICGPNFLGVNTNVYIRPEEHGSVARKDLRVERRKYRGVEEHVTPTTEADINHGNGFIFYQLGRLFRYHGDYSRITTAWEASGSLDPNTRWEDTGYVVVQEITARGEARGVWIIFNPYPVVEDLQVRQHVDTDLDDEVKSKLLRNAKGKPIVITRIATSPLQWAKSPDDLVQNRLWFDVEETIEWECQIVGLKLVGKDSDKLVRQYILRTCSALRTKRP